MATGLVNLSDYHFDSSLDGSSFKIILVVSEWNESITNSLKSATIESLLALKVNPENIKTIYVPGSFELVYASRIAIEMGYDAVIAIGNVIRGETSHFDYVCQGVTNGIQQLNVMGAAPVIFCVLTDDTIEQSRARSGGSLGNKGEEAAVAAIEMAHL